MAWGQKWGRRNRLRKIQLKRIEGFKKRRKHHTCANEDLPEGGRKRQGDYAGRCSGGGVATMLKDFRRRWEQRQRGSGEEVDALRPD